MSQLAISTSSMVGRMIRPIMSSSCLFGLTMFMGDFLGQSLTTQTTIDIKRSISVGISGFLVSGPLSFCVGKMVHKLYPGFGRLTVLKRVFVTSCISPLTIACGIVPSVYIQTRNPEKVHDRLVNRVPLNWALSVLLLSPFSYVHSRIIVRRFQSISRNSYNVVYNSIVSCKNNNGFEDDFLFDMLF